MKNGNVRHIWNDVRFVCKFVAAQSTLKGQKLARASVRSRDQLRRGELVAECMYKARGMTVPRSSDKAKER